MEKEEEKLRLARVWYKQENVKNTWSEVSKYPHIFLVNAPLTFGHSQLVFPAPPGADSVNESTLFGQAAVLIEYVLKVFKTVFGDEKLRVEAPFQKLAEDTYSSGKYIKTLILRTSADDAPNKKIKFHLVPYFESNEAACYKRFHSIRNRASPDQKGGMIGWLGERETEVDNWSVDGFPGPLPLDQTGRDIWKLPELANRLKQALPP